MSTIHICDCCEKPFGVIFQYKLKAPVSFDDLEICKSCYKKIRQEIIKEQNYRKEHIEMITAKGCEPSEKTKIEFQRDAVISYENLKKLYIDVGDKEMPIIEWIQLLTNGLVDFVESEIEE